MAGVFVDPEPAKRWSKQCETDSIALGITVFTLAVFSVIPGIRATESPAIDPNSRAMGETMYYGKSHLLVENTIDRYLINSAMLPSLKKNPDGSITIYIQKDSPSPDKQSNWLPAPDGPIFVVLRLYMPKEAVLNGTWKPPAVQTVR